MPVRNAIKSCLRNYSKILHNQPSINQKHDLSKKEMQYFCVTIDSSVILRSGTKFDEKCGFIHHSHYTKESIEIWEDEISTFKTQCILSQLRVGLSLVTCNNGSRKVRYNRNFFQKFHSCKTVFFVQALRKSPFFGGSQQRAGPRGRRKC